MKPGPSKQTTLAFSSKSTNESKAKTPDAKEEDHEDEVQTPKSDEEAVNEQLASELKTSSSPNGKGAFLNSAWPLSGIGP